MLCYALLCFGLLDPAQRNAGGVGAGVGRA